MRRLFSQMIVRPVDALASSMGMFGRHLPGRQLIDGFVSRFVYALTRPPHDEGAGVRATRPQPPARGHGVAHAGSAPGPDRGVFDSNTVGPASGSWNDLRRDAGRVRAKED